MKEYLRRVATSFSARRVALAYSIDSRKAMMFGTRSRANSFGLDKVMVRAHERKVDVPERSFLRSSLNERREAMLERIRKAVKG